MKNSLYSRYIGITKGSLMVMRTSIVALALFAVAASASTESDKSSLGKIQSEMYSIVNKAGIDFSGTFRSQFLSSGLDEKSGDSSVNWGNNRTETNEFTSVDFDIKARPNEALSARLIFRMHQNWQNFYSDIANPIFTRWISIDGNVRDMFRFNAGDYRQHYSPLTLWSPDIEIDYEPEIFAAKRREAMNEVFIGNNDRRLQGVNFNMDAEVVPLFNEFHLNATMARLRCEGTNFKNGSAPTDAFEEAIMDRYLVGANLDLMMLKGLGVGASVLKVFDFTSTYNGSVYKADLAARSGLITAFRLKPNTSIFIENELFNAGLDFEVAMSGNRDSAWYRVDTVRQGEMIVSIDTTVETKNIDGTAMNIDFKGTVHLDDVAKIKFLVGFMKNDSAFFNEMAQSPTFIGQRIMNVENDENTGRLYTTFDALYNHVFKFVPNTKLNSWQKAPRQKISYVTAILEPAEIDSIERENESFFVNHDRALQTVLPYGPATPNRTGPKGEFDIELLEGSVEMGVDFAMLNEVSPESGFEKAKFTKLGFGGCINLAKWVEVLNTCKISAGYSLENWTVKGPGVELKGDNAFLNAGLYYNFWQRFSLLAGYQQIVNKYSGEPEEHYSDNITQSQWALGLEYKVSETSRLVGRFGNVGVKHDNQLFEIWDFSTTQTEIFLTVDF